MNKKKVIIGVLIAVIFVMISFSPITNAAPTHASTERTVQFRPVNNISSIKTQINTGMYKQLNYHTPLLKNSKIQYKTYDNFEIMKISIKNASYAKYNGQSGTYTSGNIYSRSVIQNNVDKIVLIFPTTAENNNAVRFNKQANNVITPESCSADGAGFKGYYSGGYAGIAVLVAKGTALSYDPVIDMAKFGAMISGTISSGTPVLDGEVVYAGTELGEDTGLAISASTVAGAVAVVIVAAITIDIAADVWEHPGPNGQHVLYIELGESFDVKPDYWTFWNIGHTGIYGEIGAYVSGTYVNSNGNTIQGGYYPALTTNDIMAHSLASQRRHSNIWNPGAELPWPSLT